MAGMASAQAKQRQAASVPHFAQTLFRLFGAVSAASM